MFLARVIISVFVGSQNVEDRQLFLQSMLDHAWQLLNQEGSVWNLCADLKADSDDTILELCESHMANASLRSGGLTYSADCIILQMDEGARGFSLSDQAELAKMHTDSNRESLDS